MICDITQYLDFKKIQSYRKMNNNRYIYVYTKDQQYTESFGYEWEKYKQTHNPLINDNNFWQKRLELTLGFPLELLENKTVLELGCGAGRFTLPLSEYAKYVIAVDMSEAIYHNIAVDKENVYLVKSDIFDLPLLNKVDVVICRGVIQHTPNPKKTIEKLFDFAKLGGIVVFDVYKKQRNQIFNYKYFSRKIFPKIINYGLFDKTTKKHVKKLYLCSQLSNRAGDLFLLGSIFKKTPFYFPENYKQLYRNATQQEKEQIFLSHLIDGIYSFYDNPMTPEDIISTLSVFGQYPYSYDLSRNMYRCKKTRRMYIHNPKITKHGIQWQQV